MVNDETLTMSDASLSCHQSQTRPQRSACRTIEIRAPSSRFAPTTGQSFSLAKAAIRVSGIERVDNASIALPATLHVRHAEHLDERTTRRGAIGQVFGMPNNFGRAPPTCYTTQATRKCLVCRTAINGKLASWH
ncbi:hypothetical protein [Variovorax sp. J22R115]|uniref:hypothetical protein n=1 Tax=Variovorax sp. J22R115 TaxID=3053509 RepID=UPI00257599FE|nr:hypothetical protein [Variovorax sp. J22R115]MDM0052977.1 hypothetical protein [Variovorax sp. J22R115]